MLGDQENKTGQETHRKELGQEATSNKHTISLNT
jgi:hypothetical protein